MWKIRKGARHRNQKSAGKGLYSSPHLPRRGSLFTNLEEGSEALQNTVLATHQRACHWRLTLVLNRTRVLSRLWRWAWSSARVRLSR
jgi:hypothetical protein